MGKKIKKETKGEQTQYITRSKAIRKLQIKLKDFRRLCILKGVYPREPRKKFEGNSKSYYHVKDINFLMHEKILSKFREIKAHMKKYKKAKIRNNKLKAEKLLENAPKYTLHHLVKERYPSFVDALRDLDDPLCLINLFASFPTHKEFGVPRDRIATCMRLTREFNLFVIQSQCLRKAFLSIKGIYYQAEIMGQKIVWITPYLFTQNLPMEIDYKVMLTFLEFYEILLKFVNYKLFTSINISYPIETDVNHESNVYNSYNSFLLKEKEKKNSVLEKEEEEKYKISETFLNSDEVKKLNDNENFPGRNLFKNLVFFLGREVPRYSLEFVILSFGGKVYWDGSDSAVSPESPTITHFITDRDPAHIKFLKNREYVQPQWVYDCINNATLLPVKEYSPGKVLPPHLSPFVDNEKEGYVPERQKEIDRLKGESIEEEKEIDNEEEAEKQESGEEDDIEEEEEDSEREEFNIEKEKLKEKKKEIREKEENRDLAKSMLTKKNRRILQRIEYGKEKKKKEAEKLATKADKLKKTK